MNWTHCNAEVCELVTVTPERVWPVNAELSIYVFCEFFLRCIKIGSIYAIMELTDAIADLAHNCISQTWKLACQNLSLFRVRLRKDHPFSEQAAARRADWQQGAR